MSLSASIAMCVLHVHAFHINACVSVSACACFGCHSHQALHRKYFLKIALASCLEILIGRGNSIRC